MQTLLLLILMVPVSTLFAGQIHKWVDADGKVHFGDRPPENQKSETIAKPKMSGTETPPHNSTEQTDKYLQEIERERAKEKAAAEKAAVKKQKQQAACDLLKRQLALFENGGRIYTTEASGERRFYSSKEIDENRIKYRKLVKENCQ